MSLRRYAVDNNQPGCLPDRADPSPFYRTPEEAHEALISMLDEVNLDFEMAEERLNDAVSRAKEITAKEIEELHIGEEVSVKLNGRNYYIQAVLISEAQANAENSHYGTAGDLMETFGDYEAVPITVVVNKGGVWQGNGVVMDMHKTYNDKGQLTEIKLVVPLPGDAPRIKHPLEMALEKELSKAIEDLDLNLAKEIQGKLNGVRESAGQNPLQVGDVVRQKPDGDGKTKLPAETLGKVVEVHDEHTVTVKWLANAYAPTRGFVDSFLPVRTKVTRDPRHEVELPPPGGVSPANEDWVKRERRKIDHTNAGLVPGKKYRITYKSEAQRNKREAVLQFLEEVEGELVLSARPVAGTQKMPRSWIIDITDVSDSTECYMDKVVR